MNLERKIEERSARVAVIGLGYVGLPLAVEFARAGFPITGIDADPRKVRSINRGRSYIGDVPPPLLRDQVRDGRIRAVDDYAVLRETDCILICVPTPLRKTRDPDVSFIVNAVERIARHSRGEQLIVLESTTYPGTTDELILPMLEATGRKAGKDFYLAFSPERVDPGNPVFQTRNIPKVIGGVTPLCTRMARRLYACALENVIPVSSTRVAEMVKLTENTFRSVNIGLVNEICLMCNRMGIDVWEVIGGAATKPFGFMPFYPGPGLGGHCIPIDPLYLSWKARLHNFEARFIELAASVNSFMPTHVVLRIAEALNRHGKCLMGSRILLLGMAYKRDVDDVRESPALEIAHLLLERGAKVSFSDPLVGEVRLGERRMRSVKLTPANLRRADCAVIVTDHGGVNYQRVVDLSALVFDTRNATRGLKRVKRKVVRL